MKLKSNILARTYRNNTFKLTNILYTIIILSLAALSCSKERPTANDIRQIMQNRLDDGETPLEIYNSIDLRYPFKGLHYRGGIISYFNHDEGTGLIVSHQDLQDSAWGCDSILIPDLPLYSGSFTLTYDYGVGQPNTLKIINSGCAGSSAARICSEYTSEGYDDWFLPSLGELGTLRQFYSNAKGEYWSSTAASIPQSTNTEQDTSSAWTMFINDDSSCIVNDGNLGTINICAFKKARIKIKKIRAARYF